MQYRSIYCFYSIELHLIIELDGPVHSEEYQKARDKRRSAWLVSQGQKIIRFRNDEVLFERENAIRRIAAECELLKAKNSASPPNLTQALSRSAELRAEA